VPEGGVYSFVRSPDEALAAGIAAAGDKDVDIFSASIGTQFLLAGRIDELRIHLVPVLLGIGARLTEGLGGHLIRLEHLSTSQRSMATHLRYAVHRK
jgi:dihydrofolate reductase